MDQSRRDHENTWVVILAGGEGRRLQSLTTTSSGICVPKQFCSLQGGSSLLEETLRRALILAPSERVCTVVSALHRRWWQDTLASFPTANIIAEPTGRGTAIGLLVSLLHISSRSPDARIVLLPSDHYIQDETVLAQALRHATTYVESHPDRIVLLGMEPDEPDVELGYILPGRCDEFGTFEIVRFVEKPSARQARELIEDGALWNSFILIATVKALLNRFEQHFPQLVVEMRRVMSDLAKPTDATALSQLYSAFPVLDVSADVLENRPTTNLRVLPTAPCGWTDLGTPKRVADTLRRLPRPRTASAGNVPATSTRINLADQQERLQHAS